MNKSALIPAAADSSPLQPVRNAAVLQCSQAYDAAYQSSPKKDYDDYDAQQCAAKAYRKAMPDLSGYENIRDFIACTAQGMLNRAIDPIEGAKFLYAAQVAMGILHREPKIKKTPTHPPYPQVTNPLPNSNNSNK